MRLGEGIRPALSPDGKWVACIVADGPKTDLTLLPTGAGEARTLNSAGVHYERVEWFPDSQRLLVTGNEPNQPLRSFVQDLRGGNPQPLTPPGRIASRVSPDQKWVTSTAGGKLSLFPLAGGEPKEIAPIERGESAVRWTSDGRYLYLRKLLEPAVLRINKLDVANGRAELWKELKTPDPVGVQISQVAITPDGSAYAYSYQRDISTLYVANNLK